MQRAVTKSALRTSSQIAKVTTRLSSTAHTSPTSTSGTPGKHMILQPVSSSLTVTATDAIIIPILRFETEYAPSAGSKTHPESTSTSVTPEISPKEDQIGIETLVKTASETVPNAKPAGVSEWMHSMIGQSKTMQCLLYGVQNPADNRR